MRATGVVALGLLFSPFAFSQSLDSNRPGVSPSVVTARPNSAFRATPSPQGQTPVAEAAQPPSYANYSVMLVNPVVGAGAVVLMHTPKGSLEYVDVKQIQAALNNGYVPVRAAEILDSINYLHAENDRLAAENARLKGSAATGVVVVPQAQPAASSPAQIAAEQRAEAAARRQQMIQMLMMMQNTNRPQTQNLNVNVTDCTRYPALCVGR